jgi:hypothetical protein
MILLREFRSSATEPRGSATTLPVTVTDPQGMTNASPFLRLKVTSP